MLSQLSYDPSFTAAFLLSLRYRDQEKNLRKTLRLFAWISAFGCFYENKLCGRPGSSSALFKEVIQPQVPLRLPCYDFTPVMNHTVVIVPLAVRLITSGATHSHGVTGGVYKARERIHRGVLIHDY